MVFLYSVQSASEMADLTAEYNGSTSMRGVRGMLGFLAEEVMSSEGSADAESVGEVVTAMSLGRIVPAIVGSYGRQWRVMGVTACAVACRRCVRPDCATESCAAGARAEVWGRRCGHNARRGGVSGARIVTMESRCVSVMFGDGDLMRRAAVKAYADIQVVGLRLGEVDRRGATSGVPSACIDTTDRHGRSVTKHPSCTIFIQRTTRLEQSIFQLMRIHPFSTHFTHAYSSSCTSSHSIPFAILPTIPGGFFLLYTNGTEKVAK